jgi:predicted permease
VPLDRTRRDAAYALRTLRREPGFVAGVVTTFALAIGINAAMFGLVTRLMLAPPPGIGAADRVARVQLRALADDGSSYAMSTMSYPTFRALRSVTAAFESLAATRRDSMLVGRGADLAQVTVLAASGDFSATLQARPHVGRWFGPSEDEPPNGSLVVVLGYSYWSRMFGAERSALGREMTIDGRSFTIVGVAPPGFNGDQLSAVDVFMPLSASFGGAGDWVSNQHMNVVNIVARLRDGVAPSLVAQMAGAALRDESRSAGRARTSVELEPVVPGDVSRRTPQARVALWLAAVSVIVLLIATANVGTLLSVRWARRRRSTAIRLALGATRADLARQALIESMVLAAIGCAAGLLLSRWIADIVRVTLLPGMADASPLVDKRVLAASIVATCAAGMLAGLAPLSQARRASLADELRPGAEGAPASLAFRNTLVTVQVALCTLLVAGAALFTHSLQRIASQDLGFSTDKLLYVNLDFRGYVPGEERDDAYYAALRRVRALADVGSATVVAGVPFGPHNIPPVSVPSLPWPPTSVQIPIMYGATPEYEDIMGLRLVSGRLLTSADRTGTPLVALVNEALARFAWPGRSPLGQCLRAGFGASFGLDDGMNPAEFAPCRVIVGVVRDSRARSLLPDRGEDRLMQYYLPFDQIPEPPFADLPHVMGLIVRAKGDVDHAASDVQRAIQSSSAHRVYARTRAYQDLIDPQLRSWRLGATLFSAFGVLALGIAVVGLFGVVSFVVAQRTREIGVRLALGGTSRTIVRVIVGDAIRMVAGGIGLGVIGALLAGPVVASMLFRTSPREPMSMALAASTLIVATLAAAAWPAWRAGGVDPTVALRAE